MKKIVLVLLLIAISISAQNYKRYQFKSGKVVYQSSGSMSGTEILYFDNYGLLELKETKNTIEIMGMKQEINTDVIMKDRWVYSIDKKTNTASKVENPIYTMFPNGIDGNKVGIEMMEKVGGKKIGTESVNGKDCEIWEIEKLKSKVWIWKSIPIKTEINIMGMDIKQIATSVEVDIEISPNKFNLPSGVKIKNMDNIDLNSIMGNK
jgi:hypothetical protein